MSAEINPYAAPQSDPGPWTADEEISGKKRRRFAIVLAWLILIGSPIAAAVAQYDIESIVVSGAVLSFIALILIALAARRDLRSLIVLSVAMLAMSAGCFLTIYLKEWSPSDAQKPVGKATIVFAVAVQLGWVLIWRARQMHQSQP